MSASKNSWTFYIARDNRLNEVFNKNGLVIPSKTTLVENNTYKTKSIWNPGPYINNVSLCNRGYHSSSSLKDAIKYSSIYDIVVMLCLNSGHFRGGYDKVVASERHVIGYIRLNSIYDVDRFVYDKCDVQKKRVKRDIIKMIKEQGVINPKYKNFNFSIDRKPKLK